MQEDQFAPLPRGKLLAYSVIIASLMIVGVIAAIVGGAPFWRVILVAAVLGIMFFGTIAGVMWISGGNRSLNNHRRVVPVRLQKALPYIFGVILVSYLLEFIGLFGKK